MNYLISGAGSGIGRAIAIHLSKLGNNTILVGRSLESLEKTNKMLDKGEHQVLNLDIRSKPECLKAAESLKQIPLHGIIANAGIGGENKFGDQDRWDEIIDTNLTGTYLFVESFLTNISKDQTKARHIILTSSVLARLGVANYTAYCASKSGLLGLMRSWAIALADENILVNAICPGWVDTKMAQAGLSEIAKVLKIKKDEFYDIAMQSVPLSKMSDATEIAELVAYLLSQKSMTGQTIDINNGSVMNS
jgi:NAD(P)-dependent dehydrogenase (short-subunit alcohol dehydrogenase family)